MNKFQFEIGDMVFHCTDMMTVMGVGVVMERLPGFSGWYRVYWFGIRQFYNHAMGNLNKLEDYLK